MSDKKRWPLADAMKVAEEIVEALSPSCERLLVAGSMRRKKPTVGDVEIVFIPRFEPRSEDMFTVIQWSLAEDAIFSLMANGRLSKRPSINGTFAFGPKNKLMLHNGGIPVDLFTATPENWWNYVVCRTGGAENNKAIAMAAQQRGWKWNPYGSGFSRGGALAGEREVHAVSSERDVFDFVGLPYLEPEERT